MSYHLGSDLRHDSTTAPTTATAPAIAPKQYEWYDPRGWGMGPALVQTVVDRYGRPIQQPAPAPSVGGIGLPTLVLLGVGGLILFKVLRK